MPTTPVSDEMVAKLKGATAWRFSSQLGPVFTPRFFCCTDPNDMGLVEGKNPVAVLELSPNPCFVGENVAFDGTDSYDPDGTVTGYAFTFPSGTPGSSSADSGTVSWAAAGEYAVTLVVTDGTGLKSTPARIVQRVLDPGGSYLIGTTTGVYLTSDGGQNWDARNGGLSGDALNVKDLLVDPATQNLGPEKETIWIATAGGLYVSNDEDADWTQKNPASVSNPDGDDPAPAVADLTFTKLLFVGERLFAIAEWQNGGGDYRSWVFYSDDAPVARTDLAAVVTWAEL
jgi:hypothetical protein